jgi:CDP-glucose 4,6-dehydratase
MFSNSYRNRRVLVTGHTGFKGAWLTRWLQELGADVTGLSLAPDTSPNLFSLLNLTKHIRHHEADIRDATSIRNIVAECRPEIVLHLAAQPLVRLSYREPKATWDTNVGGTVNLLEAIRSIGGVRACVVVTSDKCYENREQIWGYREGDAMGGHDPYSASKGATELAVTSWRRSFFHDSAGCQLASARAGNVIGGGDWSVDRIVVDFVKAITASQPLVLRNPNATRPWQHVLEPLSGYLDLASRLYQADGHRFADGWNFGPADDSVVTVGELAKRLVAAWGQGHVDVAGNTGHPHEAGLLTLDCRKARTVLGWHGIWAVDETVNRTVSWYRSQHHGHDAESLTLADIHSYTAAARASGMPWTK